MTILGARAWAVDSNNAEQEKQMAKKNVRARFMWFPGPWNFRNTLDDLRRKMRVVRGLGNGSPSEKQDNQNLGCR